jgi:transcriptional regulator with XRE-family HTH domain
MKETFGQRLQRLRQEAGMSQPGLAAAAAIPLGTLRNLEQDRRVPRLDTADALARAIGVSLDTLTNDAFMDEPPAAEPAKPRRRPKKTDAGETPSAKKTTRKKNEK